MPSIHGEFRSTLASLRWSGRSPGASVPCLSVDGAGWSVYQLASLSISDMRSPMKIMMPHIPHQRARGHHHGDALLFDMHPVLSHEIEDEIKRDRQREREGMSGNLLLCRRASGLPVSQGAPRQ